MKRIATLLIVCCLGLLFAASACFAQYTITDVGTLGGQLSYSLGINASGQVVGLADITGNFPHAFRTAPNSPINPATDDLGTLGGQFSWAYGINDSGQVVGVSYGAPPLLFWPAHAFRTAPNSPINPATDDLGTPGLLSEAYGINNSGQVVGYAFNDYSDYPYRTAPNSPINPVTDDLGTLGGTFLYNSTAYGINDSGQVVGLSYTTDNRYHAFRTAPNSPINPATDDLGTLGGNTASYAFGVNASGQVVGLSYTRDATNTSHAFVYRGGVMYDLNDLIPAGSGWLLTLAYSINDAGQIVGYSTYAGNDRAFLLTPITPYLA